MTDDPWLDGLPRVLTLAEAERRGIPFYVVRRHVRAGRWLRLAPGVYRTGRTATARDHVRAAVAHGGPGAVVSGAAALHEYGFRSVAAPPGELVLVPAASGARNAGRIQVRRTARLPDPEPRPGPPLAPVARAAVDHARNLLTIDDVRAVVAEAVQREFCAADDLWAEVEAGRRNGRALVRAAVLEVAAGARSAPEARAAAALRRAGLGPFLQNAELIVAGRRFVVDFLWPELRAILEIDSVEHHAGLLQWRRTLDRHLLLETGGYSTIHVPPSSLYPEAAFIARVSDWLASRRDQLASDARFRSPNAS